MVGGVMSNNFIRRYLSERLAGTAELFFPEPAFSPDNAVGAAFASLLG